MKYQCAACLGIQAELRAILSYLQSGIDQENIEESQEDKRTIVLDLLPRTHSFRQLRNAGLDGNTVKSLLWCAEIFPSPEAH